MDIQTKCQYLVGLFDQAKTNKQRFDELVETRDCANAKLVRQDLDDLTGEMAKYFWRHQFRQAIEGAIRLGSEQFGDDPETRFKVMTVIYISVLMVLAGDFSRLDYNIGNVSYNKKANSMLVPCRFDNNNFTDFLEFVRERFNLIPQILREKITLYLGEHDNFLDSKAAIIDKQGFRIIDDPGEVPGQNDELSCGSVEQTKVLEFSYNLRKKLWELIKSSS